MNTTIIIDKDSIISPLTHTPQQVREAVTLLISTDFVATVNKYVRAGEKILKKELNILLDGKDTNVSIFRLDPDVASNLVDLAYEIREDPESDYLRIVTTSYSNKKVTIIFS